MAVEYLVLQAEAEAGPFARVTARKRQQSWETLQAALDDWQRAGPALERLAAELAAGRAASFELDIAELAAPLPRAFEWVDGSAYIEHIRLVRKARGAEPPATLETDPGGDVRVRLGLKEVRNLGEDMAKTIAANRLRAGTH